MKLYTVNILQIYYTVSTVLYSSTVAKVIVQYNFPIKNHEKHKFKTHEKCESIVVNC